jgi:C4-dicarboxylate transporter DctM subunit
MSIMKVAQAALPWTMVLLAFLILITYVPAVTMFLPNLLF